MPGETKKTLVIPGLTRNPVRQSNFSRPLLFPGPSRHPQGKFLRRFAPKKTILDSGSSPE
jgi:hypothetical protein